MSTPKAKSKMLSKEFTDAVQTQMSADVKNASMVVSVIINMFLFSTWLVLELTDAFNSQIISYLQQ
jgi:hypothetical protein